MSTSELVTPLHLQKKAIIYIRQSTPHQQISNQESLRLQYTLRERAQRLGWHAADVEIIDADLGLTGASAQHRTGFQELLAKEPKAIRHCILPDEKPEDGRIVLTADTAELQRFVIKHLKTEKAWGEVVELQQEAPAAKAQPAATK